MMLSRHWVSPTPNQRCSPRFAIHQNALLLASIVGAGDTAKYDLATGRRACLHVVRGTEAELLLFDLPWGGAGPYLPLSAKPALPWAPAA